MQHGVPRSSPTPTTDQRADDAQAPGSTPATTLPVGTTVPATTVPATTSTGSTGSTGSTAPTGSTPASAPVTTDVVGVVDVAGPPVPAAFQQLGVGGSSASSATNSATAVVAAKGPLPSQALPTTGAASIDTAGVAALLLVAGLVAVRLSRASQVARRRRPDAV